MGSIKQETDVLVIGAGPAGYVAAIRAASLGHEVTLVEERKELGGVCLIEGCIPSKTLIHAVEVASMAKEAKKFGLELGEATWNLDALRKNKQKVVKTLTGGVSSLLKARGVEVVHGRARFDGPQSVALSESDVAGIEFKRAILATGSRPARLPFGDDLELWSSREALDIPEVPERLLVIGGGYIGLELGLVYAGLGSKVTTVELLPQLLTGADPDLVQVVHKRCKARFEQIMLETKVTGIEKSSGGYAVSVEKDGESHKLEFDRVLVAVGRKPNTEDIGLEKAGLEVDDDGLIEVDQTCRTSAENIYAIGDITPGPMLAHKGSRQAKVAAEVIAGHPAAFDNRAIPAVVFTDPELAWAGLTEEEAKAAGREVTVGKFPMTALGRGRSIGKTEGFAKILADPETNLVLGVGLVGPHASDLIAEGALAIEMGATLEDLMDTIHPHPTLSELLCEAAEVTAGAPIHVPPPRERKR
jgi:dihydrolipoamide dehydrogenase